MKRYLLLLLVLAFSLIMAGCKENDKPQTTKEVIRFAERKGVENLDWKDFDHLKHEEFTSGILGVMYELTDGNYLALTGFSYEEKPEVIYITNKDMKAIKSIKR